MNKAIELLLKNCRKELGYKANNANPPKRYNKYAEYLDSLGNIYNGKKNGYHWCDIFVDYMFLTTFGVELGMKLLCQPYKGLGAGCTYSARYFKNKGQLKFKPTIGSQIFFGTEQNCNHTGIVTDYDKEYVYTIEGNSSNSVAERKYKITDPKIYAYGEPDWGIVKMQTETRYRTLEDIPAGFYRDSISYLIKKNYLAGKDGGVLDLSEDMIRCFIVSARMAGVI